MPCLHKAAALYYSPDGRNLGGGGTSVRIYDGADEILQIVPVGSGDAVVTLFQGGSAFYSPNNRDIGGGGTTVSAAPSARSSSRNWSKPATAYSLNLPTTRCT